MKLKSIVLAVASVLFVLGAHAQPYYVDLASPNTNIVDTYGTLTVSNTALYGITNAPFHNHATNIVAGEYVLTAFQKQNSNTVWLAAQGVTNYDLWMNLNNYVFTYALTNGGTGYTFSGDTVTNSRLTNSTYAGNGFYLTGVSSNSFDSDTLSWLQSIGAGGSYPDITDTGGNVGISQTSPAYPLDIGGNMEIGFTAGGNGNYIQGDDGSGNIVINPAYGGVVKVNNELDVDAGANILQLSVDGFSMDYALFFLPGSALTAGDNADFGTDGSVSVAYGACQIDPGGNLKITTLNSDGGNFTSDGAGNVTAQTFTPLSDRTLKENIVALPPSVALAMASSLTNYEWNFKARTNLVSRLTRQRIESFTTNAVTGKVRASWVFNMTTNTVAKVIPASSRQFGPMAQDWNAVTGLDDGHHISVTAMQGLLLGSIQALNLKQAAISAQDTNAGTLYLKLPEVTIAHSTNSTYGQGAGLMASDGNYLYISTGTNAWRRLAIPAAAW